MAKTAFAMDIDSLLVCITAGYVGGNSSKRDPFVKYLKVQKTIANFDPELPPI